MIANAVFRQPVAIGTGVIYVTEAGQVIVLDGTPNAYSPGAYAPSIVAGMPTQRFDSAGNPVRDGSGHVTYTADVQPLTVKLYRGWPESSSIDRDLVAGSAHISVFAESGMTRNTTRYFDNTIVPNLTPTTLTAAVAGLVVTFGGTCVAPHLAGVGAGLGPELSTWTYATLAADTPATVAAAFAALVPGASAAGPALTMPAGPVVARVAALQTSSFETRRQTQGFRVSIWCPSPLIRDVLASIVDVALSRIRRFTLLDGTVARPVFQSAFIDDAPSKDRVWRRDIRVQVEYPTTIASLLAPLLFGAMNITPTAPAGVTGITVTI